MRYERVGALLGACGVTLVSVLGGAGLLPLASAAPRPGDDTSRTPPSASSGQPSEPDGSTRASGTTGTTDAPVTVDGAKFDRTERRGHRVARTALAVPADSGEGRRVVFDQTAQRVWLVTGAGKVARTYLVSGSVDDNLDPGEYEVYSRSMRAWGIDGGTMRYMVRFAYGDTAAIGFHDIPYDGGELMQTRAELGSATSSGCIRQWRPDAKALWRFAPLGTKVVVVAT